MTKRFPRCANLAFAACLFPICTASLLAASGNLLNADPGFEEGSAGWNFPDRSMGKITTEAAHSENQGLRISDDSIQEGSSVTSDRIAVTPGSTYTLSFRARVVSGSGLGLYLRYYENTGSKPKASEHVNVPPAEGAWKSYELQSVAPASAESVEIWVHSYGPAKVVADLDDITLIPAGLGSSGTPTAPRYKISPDDTSRLTEADVVGPDGIVYPNWKLAGVPGGIPEVPDVVGAEFFAGYQKKDVSARLREAIGQAVAAGGGAISLPPGDFYLDRPIIIRDSGIVIRGSGTEKTRLIFRDIIPRGEIRLFDWAEQAGTAAPGSVLEIQANPKNLAVLRLESAGKVLKEALKKPDPKGWGNRFSLRFTGDELLSKLRSGTHVLQATVVYEDGKAYSRSFPISLTKDSTARLSPDQNGIFVLVGPGKYGEPVALTEDGKRGSRTLKITPGHGLHAGDRILLDAPVTERWNRLVGNQSKASHFRQYFYEIANVDGDTITLTQPLRIEFPIADGSFVQRAAFLERSAVEDLTIEQQAAPEEAGFQKPASLRYWYPIEDLWLDGITSSYAWGCWFRNVKVVTAGRNPIFLTRSKFCEIRNCEADGALFKGAGGSGYVGLERSFDCLMDTVTTRNMRHAPNLQWGAAGNVVRNGKFHGSDAQWHAGWTNENLLENNLIVSNASDVANNNAYGYGLFSTGPKDPIHGPEGPRNVAYRNDVTSPKDGLYMQGGNEAWIIAYNRFRISDGRAIFGGEASLDHIIRGNTFILERASEPAIQFESSSSTGIDLVDNSFYGPVQALAGFLKGAGKFAREENNRVLPFSADAPLPDPPASSIFEWQRAQPQSQASNH